MIFGCQSNITTLCHFTDKADSVRVGYGLGVMPQSPRLAVSAFILSAWAFDTHAVAIVGNGILGIPNVERDRNSVSSWFHFITPKLSSLFQSKAVGVKVSALLIPDLVMARACNSDANP